MKKMLILFFFINAFALMSYSQIRCSVCNGYGRLICSTCNGTRAVTVYQQNIYGGYDTHVMRCPDCLGVGAFVCQNCGGEGYVRTSSSNPSFQHSTSCNNPSHHCTGFVNDGNNYCKNCAKQKDKYGNPIKCHKVYHQGAH